MVVCCAFGLAGARAWVAVVYHHGGGSLPVHNQETGNFMSGNLSPKYGYVYVIVITNISQMVR